MNVRDLAVYRVSWTVGCSFCVDFGAMLRRLAGLDLDQPIKIGDYATSPVYNDDERAAIAYVDAMTATRPEVTDEQVADLEQRFGRAGVVELTYQIVHENMRSRMNSALGITEQGFSTGSACRVPWANESINAPLRMDDEHHVPEGSFSFWEKEEIPLTVRNSTNRIAYLCCLGPDPWNPVLDRQCSR